MNFGNLFSKIAPGMCRISTNGIAIKVGSDYKVYDVKSGKLINVSNFVFDPGDDMFFAIPTNKVKRGDIILATNGPATVIEASKNEIKAFDYKSGLIVQIVPERHIFLGNTYFYSKIVSPFASFGKGSLGGNNMLRLMMMNSMLKDGGDMSKMLVYGSMMGNGGFDFGSIFDNMFDSDDESNDEELAEGDE